jgi:hypothetical protein
MNATRTLLIAILFGALAGNAWCDPRRSHGNDEREGHNRRPVREVIGEVEHNYRGRVVDVQAPRPGSSEDMYRVRVLQDGGRVKTLRVPAERRRD